MDRRDLLRGVVRNLDPKLFFERHDQLDDVEAVGTQIVDEACVLGNLVGFNTEMLLDLRARLDKLEIERAPFTKAVGLPRVRAHWVRPEIVVQVGFIEWTVHGKLRHPRLLAVIDTTKNDHSP